MCIIHVTLLGLSAVVYTLWVKKLQHLIFCSNFFNQGLFWYFLEYEYSTKFVTKWFQNRLSVLNGIFIMPCEMQYVFSVITTSVTPRTFKWNITQSMKTIGPTVQCYSKTLDYVSLAINHALIPGSDLLGEGWEGSAVPIMFWLFQSFFDLSSWRSILTHPLSSSCH